jgi:acetyltransferase-like isoleucine patch superfamily enzyme
MINVFNKIRKHDIPLHFVLKLTNWLPDNIIFIRLRGKLASPFFLSCGKNLGLGRNVTFYNPSNISIGSDVYVAYGCWICGPLIIEDQVLFGPYCVISPGNHQREKKSFRFSPITEGKAHIKKGSWLGAHSLLIGKSPTLGKGSVLAANSTLLDIAENDSLYAGSPAKKIKKL